MMTWKQAERQERDGQVSAEREVDEGLIYLTVVDNGKEMHIRMTPHNASRAFAFLALMLEIPLPKSIAKAIKL